MKCRHCHEGIQVGANQCVKRSGWGLNLHVADHSTDWPGLTIEGADVDEFIEALQAARGRKP